MLNVKVFQGNKELREIEVESNNFLLVQNGSMGPVYDNYNFKYLKLDEKHVICHCVVIREIEGQVEGFEETENYGRTFEQE